MLGRAIIIVALLIVVAWLIGGLMRGRTRR
jgi:hypothetical protein